MHGCRSLLLISNNLHRMLLPFLVFQIVHLHDGTEKGYDSLNHMIEAREGYRKTCFVTVSLV